MKLFGSSLRGFFLLVVCAATALAQGAPSLRFAPLRQYSNRLGTGPELAVFNGVMYSAFMANDSSNSLWISKSGDGVNWTYPGQNYSNIKMLASTGPGIAAYNGLLYISWFDSNHFLWYATSADGVNFSAPIVVRQPNNGAYAYGTGQPSMAVWNGALWIGYENDVYDSTTTYLNWVTFENGTWSVNSNETCFGPNGEEPQTGAAIGVASYNGSIYFAFQAQGNWGHHLVVCTLSGNSAPYAQNSYVYSNIQAGSGISATPFNGSLYLAFKDLSGNNYLHLSGTSNGTTFTDTVYSSLHTNGRQQIVPGTTVFNGVYFLQFVQNDTGHYMENTYAY